MAAFIDINTTDGQIQVSLLAGFGLLLILSVISLLYYVFKTRRDKQKEKVERKQLTQHLSYENSRPVISNLPYPTGDDGSSISVAGSDDDPSFPSSYDRRMWRPSRSLASFPINKPFPYLGVGTASVDGYPIKNPRYGTDHGRSDQQKVYRSRRQNNVYEPQPFGGRKEENDYRRRTEDRMQYRFDSPERNDQRQFRQYRKPAERHNAADRVDDQHHQRFDNYQPKNDYTKYGTPRLQNHPIRDYDDFETERVVNNRQSRNISEYVDPSSIHNRKSGIYDFETPRNRESQYSNEIDTLYYDELPKPKGAGAVLPKDLLSDIRKNRKEDMSYDNPVYKDTSRRNEGYRNQQSFQNNQEHRIWSTAHSGRGNNEQPVQNFRPQKNEIKPIGYAYIKPRN